MATNGEVRVEWETFRVFKCDLFGGASGDVEEGDLACEINRLPLPSPRYSFRFGVWRDGRLQGYFRPMESDIEVRVDALASLYREAERVVAAARAADRERGGSTMAPRIGKTERDRQKRRDPANATNDPSISRSMKGAAGGRGRIGR